MHRDSTDKLFRVIMMNICGMCPYNIKVVVAFKALFKNMLIQLLRKAEVFIGSKRIFTNIPYTSCHKKVKYGTFVLVLKSGVKCYKNMLFFSLENKKHVFPN